MEHARRPDGPDRLRPRRRRRPRLHPRPARHRPLCPRPLSDHVCRQPLDHPPVCRLLDRRGLQRLLPPQPRRRSEGAVDRLRSGHAPGLRFRPPAGEGRRRHGRGGHRQHLRHADPVRRHSARPDVGVHDHERCRPADPGPLCGRRRGTGRGTGGPDRDHPERHPQGVHGPQHLHLSARTLDADRVGHLRLDRRAHAEIQLHLDQRLPYAGGRGLGRSGAGLHPRRRGRISESGRRGGHGRRPVRAAPELLLGHRHELFHGGGQAARRPPAVGRGGVEIRRQGPPLPVPARPLPDLRLVAGRAGRVQQCAAHHGRGHGRGGRPDPEPAHQCAGRSAGPADRLLGPHRAQHPAAAADGDGPDQGHRPLGRQLLRRTPDPRTGEQGPRSDGRGRGPGRDGEGHRGRRAQDADRGGLGPHPGADRHRPADRRRREPLPVRRGRRHPHAQGRQRRRADRPDRQAETAAGRTRRNEDPGRAGRPDRRGEGEGQPAGTVGPGGARLCHRRGDLRCTGGRLRPPCGDGENRPRRLCARGRQQCEDQPRPRHGRRLRRQ